MTKTVLVIGAGITGVSCAEWLRRDGLKVTLVDRVRPGDPLQTSYGNGGLLARCAVIPVSVPGILAKAPKMLLDPDGPLFMKWRYLPQLLPWLIPFLRNGSPKRVTKIARSLAALTEDSVDQHLSLARGTGAEKYITTGEYSYLYRSRKDFLKDGFGMGLRAANGFTWSERNDGEVHEADPNLSADYQFAAVFKDHGWITNPGKHVAALADHFLRQGGVFHRGEVVDIDNSGVLLKDGTQLKADKIVLATGIWSKVLAEKLGHRAPLQSERGYHLVLKDPSHTIATPYMVTDGKFVVTPMEDGLRCAGVVEFGGTQALASDKPTALLRRAVQNVFPNLRWQDEAVWMGHRPSTPDSLPMLGAAPNAPNVIFAFGSQHIGLTIGPRLGRMTADLAMGRRLNIDLSPYAANRFDKNHQKDEASTRGKQAGQLPSPP